MLYYKRNTLEYSTTLEFPNETSCCLKGPVPPSKPSSFPKGHSGFNLFTTKVTGKIELG